MTVFLQKFRSFERSWGMTLFKIQNNDCFALISLALFSLP